MRAVAARAAGASPAPRQRPVTVWPATARRRPSTNVAFSAMLTALAATATHGKPEDLAVLLAEPPYPPYRAGRARRRALEHAGPSVAGC